MTSTSPLLENFLFSSFPLSPVFFFPLVSYYLNTHVVSFSLCIIIYLHCSRACSLASFCTIRMHYLQVTSVREINTKLWVDFFKRSKIDSNTVIYWESQGLNQNLCQMISKLHCRAQLVQGLKIPDTNVTYNLQQWFLAFLPQCFSLSWKTHQ